MVSPCSKVRRTGKVHIKIYFKPIYIGNRAVLIVTYISQKIGRYIICLIGNSEAL